MGFSFRRMFRNPVSLFSPGLGGFSQFDPGSNGRDSPAAGYERRSANAVQWDPFTFRPIGTDGPPAHEVALQYQYRSDELRSARQNAIWNDAYGAVQQGTELLSGYRPGGSAVLASGLLQNRASLLAQQAISLESPDLMSAYREDAEIKAQRAASRAARTQAIVGGVQAVAGIAGLAIGGPGAAAARVAPAAIGSGLQLLGPGYGNPGVNVSANPPGVYPATQSQAAVPGGQGPAVPDAPGGTFQTGGGFGSDEPPAGGTSQARQGQGQGQGQGGGHSRVRQGSPWTTGAATLPPSFGQSGDFSLRSLAALAAQDPSFEAVATFASMSEELQEARNLRAEGIRQALYDAVYG